jgi:undecaprenyl-diphosphatase
MRLADTQKGLTQATFDAATAEASVTEGARRNRAGHARRAGLLVVLGLLLIVGAVPVGRMLKGGNSFDSSISRWFAERRTPASNSITSALTLAASTIAVIGAAITIIVVCLVRRRRTGLGVLVVGMAGEVLIFLAITALVSRPRPSVPRLDSAPPTSSFPSGHTFAVLVLWWTAFVLARRQQWPRWLCRLILLSALALPALVALSRVYRGMHHPSDVIASFLLGGIWVTAVARLLAVPTRETLDASGRS